MIAAPSWEHEESPAVSDRRNVVFLLADQLRADYVPEGRDRLGFQHWRGYNFHSDYFNGTVNVGDWRNERWEAYIDGLNKLAARRT